MATVGVDHNGQLNARMHSVATGTKPSGKTGGSFPADEGETEERGGLGGWGGEARHLLTSSSGCNGPSLQRSLS